MRKFLLISALLGLIFACQETSPKRQIKKVQLQTTESSDYPQKLSEWELFQLPLRELQPKAGLIPYDLASPLFTDYALKKRFLKIPADSTVNYREEEVLDFPIGTILIKHFYYSAAQIGEERILETRLLVHEKEAWKALSYLWNEEQSEATRQLSGASIPIALQLNSGQEHRFNYSVPNEVQCKSCHEYNGAISPIGPKAHQLNHPYKYKATTANQLAHWQKLALLANWPGEDKSPKMVNYSDTLASIDQRARAYLDINCAHCHRREGPAKNSGLYLRYQEKDPYRLGLYKSPVAAGRGSGGRKFALKPGDPEGSILYHRMASLDPGVMMPELGRKLNDQAGLKLIKKWIQTLKEPKQPSL